VATSNTRIFATLQSSCEKSPLALSAQDSTQGLVCQPSSVDPKGVVLPHTAGLTDATHSSPRPSVACAKTCKPCASRVWVGGVPQSGARQRPCFGKVAPGTSCSKLVLGGVA